MIDAREDDVESEPQNPFLDNEADLPFSPEEAIDAKHPDDPRHGQAVELNK